MSHLIPVPRQSNPLDACQLIHHGAASGVTGSCHELRLPAGGPQDSLLIDCGQFQGEDAAKPLAIALARVRAVLLTHAHIDHIGRLPELLSAGLAAPIYCSEATALLAPVMLADALRHSEGRQHATILKNVAIEPRLQRLAHLLRPLPLRSGNDCHCATHQHSICVCNRPGIFWARRIWSCVCRMAKYFFGSSFGRVTVKTPSLKAACIPSFWMLRTVN